MKYIRMSIVILACLSAPLVAEQRRTAKPPEVVQPAAPAQAPKTVALPPDVDTAAKVIQYTDKDVVKIKTKLRYTTLIVLPKGEQILDFICGDKEFWIVNGIQNFAYVKPAKAGAQTNLNLVTASGNVYTFLLAEVSDLLGNDPDLKVFVESKDESILSAAAGPPKFVPSQAIDDYRRQLELAKEETRQVKAAAQSTIDLGFSQFKSKLRFIFRFEADKKPFRVRAIYTDDKFTYIHANPDEVPALYEIKDGNPSFVNFKYENGVYVVEKVLDRGYLSIGKEKLSFRREQ